MDDKKVSVIIPIYDVVQYLDECIESVCRQTYTNVEIILVNDGSTDASGEKCNEWMKKDTRIKVIHKENGGLSSARNAGLDVATGEYIYFLDGDDYIKESLLSEIVPFMNEGYDMVSFNYYKIYKNGKVEVSSYCNTQIYEIDTVEKKQHFFVEKLLRYKLGYEACCRIFKKDIIDNYNIQFADNRIVFAEDVYFSLCYCAHSNRIINLDKILYYYRQHGASIMSRESVRLNIGRMNELGKLVLKHYMDYEDCDPLIKIFPVIYYLIVDNVLTRYKRIHQPTKCELRYAILEDISDYTFFEEQMILLKEYRYILKFVYSKVQLEVVLSDVKYYLDGKELTEKIRYQLIRIYSLMIRIYGRIWCKKN